MKTKELQKLWWDWLGTSERLLRSLYEQTAALTLRDVARVERIQPELDTMLAKIQEIDGQASACAKELAVGMGAEPSLRGLVQVLDKDEAVEVQQLANRVTVSARNIQHVLDKNRALVENELNYVNGTLTLIAHTVKKSRGKFTGSATAAVVVDQAA